MISLKMTDLYVNKKEKKHPLIVADEESAQVLNIRYLEKENKEIKESPCFDVFIKYRKFTYIIQGDFFIC